MKDKEQIIIDGVDVSKCNRLIVNQLYGYTCNCEEDAHLISSCKSRPNCHYKQLARKTQECEELKERLVRTEEDLKYQCVDCMNAKSDCYRKALEEIETVTKINCEEICGRKFTDCKDTSCFSANILDIIDKAKGR